MKQFVEALAPQLKQLLANLDLTVAATAACCAIVLVCILHSFIALQRVSLWALACVGAVQVYTWCLVWFERYHHHQPPPPVDTPAPVIPHDYWDTFVEYVAQRWATSP